MPVMGGTGVPVFALTREAFGEDGESVFFGLVSFMTLGEFDPVGWVLWGGNIERHGLIGACFHPDLIRQRRHMDELYWYSVSLEGDEVVARQCESHSGNIVQGGPEFRAPVMEFGEISFDLVLQMTELWVYQTHDRSGIGAFCDLQYGEYCTGSRMTNLDRRRTALARFANDEPTLVCSHCAHLIEEGRLSFEAGVLIDTQRLPVFAPLGYGMSHNHEGMVSLEALVSLLENLEIQKHQCHTCKTDGLEWVEAVLARPPLSMQYQAFCGSCYDKMVEAESQGELEGVYLRNEFVESTAIDGRQVKPEVPVPYYKEVPRRMR